MVFLFASVMIFSGALDPWVLPSYSVLPNQPATHTLQVSIPDEPKSETASQEEPEVAEMCPPESILEKQWITFSDDTPFDVYATIMQESLQIDADGSVWHVYGTSKVRLYEKIDGGEIVFAVFQHPHLSIPLQLTDSGCAADDKGEVVAD